ncbi:hypothetical protein BKA67DRAFT_656162 [Truncatella angustata]|uniref:FAD-binding PCMH-type domain-containing protein n=1 Tax=Truncatella angustata TaxID=152316 RepID=A0A9P8URZ4_9PEZI|nr:uncharacterized protein BKA67DRAFT_656162 [Truncatella angustata]KAH6657925.1 hypothetical protein BKA67DRAFT_656162 [Truncatella angustata]
MKVHSTLFAVGVTCLAVLVQAQEPTLFSDQLLYTLKAFPSSDAIVASLSEAIQVSTDTIDEASYHIEDRSVLSSSRSQVACQLLECILPTYYTDPSTNHSAYDTLRENNWSSNCQLPAACFISPEHPVQVAVALQIIDKLQSKFAVQSGGHNPNPGFAGVGQDGVTILMQRFQTLKLSADRSTATVGAGLRFGAVQQFLDSQGVAVVSGRNKYVGVSGLLLGGGHPIINSLTGLAADNIKSMEVVLSDFRVVTASQTTNPDLFRALKGGGNNFGVVTKFDLYTTMPRNIWYRIVSYNASNSRTVLDALVQVQRNMEGDPKAGIQVTCTPAGFTVTFVYGEYANNPAVFAPFSYITPTAESTPPANGSTLQFIELQSPPQPEASRDTVGVTTLPDTDLYLDIYNRYLAVAAANKNTSAAFLLPIQTFGSAAARIGQLNGGNVLGTSQRAQTWWNPIAQWTDPAYDKQVHNALIKLADDITSLSQARGLHDRFIFANIATRGQNVLASYGPENLDFLQGVSQKYDDAGTFQRVQNGGFLVSRS